MFAIYSKYNTNDEKAEGLYSVYQSIHQTCVNDNLRTFDQKATARLLLNDWSDRYNICGSSALLATTAADLGISSENGDGLSHMFTIPNAIILIMLSLSRTCLPLRCGIAPHEMRRTAHSRYCSYKAHRMLIRFVKHFDGDYAEYITGRCHEIQVGSKDSFYRMFGNQRGLQNVNMYPIHRLTRVSWISKDAGARKIWSGDLYSFVTSNLELYTALLVCCSS